ncbi:MAG: ATP-binding cassette domain-containing protein [Desulfomonilaceae bacterium]
MKIQVENLYYAYNPGTPLEIRAIEDISFGLSAGTFLGILGGTGSGKTTLIRNLNGLLVPTRGRVLLDGTDVRSYGTNLRRKVGVVFQRPERQLFEQTVFADISFVLRRSSSLSEMEIRNKVRSACELVGLNLDEIGERCPLTLSDGAKRKVAISGILVNAPEVLILDEPAVGLDPPSLANLIRTLEKMKSARNTTVMITSHDMEPFLPLLDLIMIMKQGRVAGFGSPSEVCEALGNDASTRDLLPELALLVHDLRSAGVPLSPDEFRIPLLVERLSNLKKLSGGAA